MDTRRSALVDMASSLPRRCAEGLCDDDVNKVSVISSRGPSIERFGTTPHAPKGLSYTNNNTDHKLFAHCYDDHVGDAEEEMRRN
jgi:hypothetical protein